MGISSHLFFATSNPKKVISHQQGASKRIGVIELLNKRRKEPFTKQDEIECQTVAKMVACIVEQASAESKILQVKTSNKRKYEEIGEADEFLENTKLNDVGSVQVPRSRRFVIVLGGCGGGGLRFQFLKKKKKNLGIGAHLDSRPQFCTSEKRWFHLCYKKRTQPQTLL